MSNKKQEIISTVILVMSLSAFGAFIASDLIQFTNEQRSLATKIDEKNVANCQQRLC